MLQLQLPARSMMYSSTEAAKPHLKSIWPWLLCVTLFLAYKQYAHGSSACAHSPWPGCRLTSQTRRGSGTNHKCTGAAFSQLVPTQYTTSCTSGMANLIYSPKAPPAKAKVCSRRLHCWGCPGTPLQNRLEELWSLLNLLMPHVFSSDQEFQAWFEGSASPGLPCGQLTEEESLLVAGRFHQILAPFMLRRLKAQVLANLPAKVHASSRVSYLGGAPVRALHECCQHAGRCVGKVMSLW